MYALSQVILTSQSGRLLITSFSKSWAWSEHKSDRSPSYSARYKSIESKCLIAGLATSALAYTYHVVTYRIVKKSMTGSAASYKLDLHLNFKG